MARILVIDDEEMVSRSIALVLRMKGFEAETASGGVDGLAKARSHRPDLILCDMNMPEMNGLQTLSQIRRDESLQSIPVFLITGRGASEELDAALKLGAQAVLLKPFQNDELVAKIQAHLATGA